MIRKIRHSWGMTLDEFAAVLQIDSKWGAKNAHRVENLQNPAFKYVSRIVRYARKNKLPLDEGELFD